MSDERDKSTLDTVPPPEGEDDAYSAATKVEMASAEILALVKQTERSEPRLPAATDDDAPPLSLSSAVIEDAPAPKKSIPPPLPKRSTAPPPAAKVSTEATPSSPGLSPAVAIVLLFVAAAAFLAALVR